MGQKRGNSSEEEEEEVIQKDWLVQRSVGPLKNLALEGQECFLPQSSATLPYEPTEVFHGAKCRCLEYWIVNEVSIWGGFD